MKFSIIIPVYNASKTIRTTVLSIINQTVLPDELILVDDGSIDESFIICKELESKYDFIKVIHQENKGVTMARRVGVENSSGEWIGFVDADDKIPIDALENFAIAISDEYDILVGEISREKKKEIVKIEEYRHRLIKRSIIVAPFAKLFRKDLFFEGIFDIPREICYGEDLLMNLNLAFSTDKKVLFIGKKVYDYLWNDNSVSSHFKDNMHYEDLYYSYLLNTIPELERDKYIHDCISFRFDVWKTLTKRKIKIKSEFNTDYYDRLVKDIKEYKYNTSIYKRMLLSNNIFIRLLLFGYIYLRECLNLNQIKHYET